MKQRVFHMICECMSMSSAIFRVSDMFVWKQISTLRQLLSPRAGHVNKEKSVAHVSLQE